MKRTLPMVLGLTLAGVSLLPAAAGEISGDAARRDLEARLARAELLAGLIEVQGPGVIVHLRNSRLTPKGVDPRALKVCEQDFNAILNVLRGAGAEALAIGGQNTAQLERVGVGTAAREGWDCLLVNGASLQPPYRILAIGDAFRMRTDLLKAGGVVKKAGLDVLEMVQVESAGRLVIPAGRAPAEFRFARRVEGEALVARVPEPEPIAPPDPARRVEPAAAPLRAALPPAPVSAPENRITGIARRPPPAASAAVKRSEPEPVPQAAPPRPEPAARPAPKPVVVAKVPPRPAARPGTALLIFGGRGLAKFHVAGCRYGERIEAEDRVRFSSAQEAQQKGRTPCAVCQQP